MRTVSLSAVLVISALSTASDCAAPLVDYDTAFFVANATSDTILIYVGDSDPPTEQPELPIDSVQTYAPIPAGETGFIAVPTEGPDLFDDLPSGVMELWVFKLHDFRNNTYNEIRLDTGLFNLITLTEDEFDAAGDTIIIN